MRCLPCRRPSAWRTRLAAVLGACLLQAACAAHGQPARSQAGAGLSGPALRAAQQATLSPDPVAARLALWLRAQVPGAASAREIDEVLRDDAAWPGRSTLLAQMQQALAREPDDQVAARLCAAWQPRSLDALVRCAAAEAPAQGAPGQMTSQPPGPPGAAAAFAADSLPPAFVAAALAAWTDGLETAGDESRFLLLFGQFVTPQAQRERFERLLSQGALPAARRQLARLSANERPLAQARLALVAGAPDALDLARRVAPPDRSDPRLLLDEARWLDRHGRLDEALALWRGPAGRAEPAAPPALQDRFARERITLARDMLAAGRNADALALAGDDVPQDLTVRLDIDFLAGWIELRRLHDPADAAARFARLTRNSHAPITLGRGFYWLGRALAAQGDAAAARQAFTQAAAYPTTFYGQLAWQHLPGAQEGSGQVGSGQADGLDRALQALRDPLWSRQEAIGLVGSELARAAALLVAWGDPRDASAFLLRLDSTLSDPAAHSMAARFADRLGLPQAAVAIARRASLSGVVLAQSGWPAPYAPPGQPALPAGLALAVMRQESSFDPAVVSPAGAHGLMQLMPATASRVAGTAMTGQALADPQTNMRLGTLYLASLLTRFGNTVPLAVAAYNAGPNRVQQWLQGAAMPVAAGRPGAAGTAAAGGVTPQPDDAMIDWIELIPFGETRNYVQRVMESQTLYRIRARDIDLAQLAWVQPPAGKPPGRPTLAYAASAQPAADR